MNIIGGVAGGHKIFAPDNIRPTRGKVREALFSMINVEGKTFLKNRRCIKKRLCNNCRKIVG
ncbi:MAG: RsmD family RNA methyltransferase [candidate division WOR-3 bacterium]